MAMISHDTVAAIDDAEDDDGEQCVAVVPAVRVLPWPYALELRATRNHSLALVRTRWHGTRKLHCFCLGPQSKKRGPSQRKSSLSRVSHNVAGPRLSDFPVYNMHAAGL